MRNSKLRVPAFYAIAFLGLTSCSFLDSVQGKKLHSKSGQIVVEKENKTVSDEHSDDVVLPETGQVQDQSSKAEAKPVNLSHDQTEMCAKFVKTFRYEPHFYQLQASIRHYQSQGQEAEFIRSHMIYHRVPTAKSRPKDDPLFKDCAEVVLSFERFAEVLAVNRAPALTRPSLLQARLENTRAAKQPFSVSSCLALIRSLEEPARFKTVRKELDESRAKLQGDKYIASALSQISAESSTDGNQQEMTSHSCLQALIKIKLDDVKKFVKATRDEQNVMITEYVRNYGFAH